jgi:hypothetical protein
MVTFRKPVPLSRVPRVSVVVPCYNYGRYLPQLLDGVLDQPGVDVDVLIVDDASPDGSGDIAEQLALEHPQVDVLRHRKNAGHIRTYNDGLRAATGDYVALLSADDLLPAGALSRAAALLDAEPRLGMVYGYARSFTHTPPSVDPNVRNWSIWEGNKWMALSARRGRCFISSPEVVMRRETMQEIGYYDPRLPHSGDFDMWLRTAVNWKIGRVNGPVQALYRVHELNMHLTEYAGWLTDLRERRKTFQLLFDEHAPSRPEVVELRPAAMRALARESIRRGLIAHRDGEPADQVAEYFEFATETDAQIRKSLPWRVAEFGQRRGRALPAAATRRLASRTRDHLVWRRERRYGT